MSWWYAIDGERLCRVRDVADRQQVDGTVMLTLPRLSEAVAFSTDPGGLFEVHDERDGMVYAAQALTAWHETESVTLVCTPLGAVNHQSDGRRDEDWLVAEGLEPVRLLGRLGAYSQCPKGDHLRLELPTAGWDRLGYTALAAPACRCDRCGGPGEARVWDFRPVAAHPGATDQPVAELVVLRERQRFAVTIDLARRAEAVTTVIGHVRSRLSWAHKPSIPPQETPI